MKFSDMEYIRPDKEKIIADIVRATEPVSYTHLDVYKRQG